MSKRAQPSSKRSAQRSSSELDNVLDFQPMTRKQRGVGKTYEAPKRVEARTETQGHYLLAMESDTLVFGLGPAGTGKSFCAAACAANKLAEQRIETIFVTRPMDGGDEEDMGSLPGTLEEKFEPWFAPIRIILEKQLGRGAVECHIKNGNIVVKPLQFLRGATFENAFVILDEAQNTSPKQMQMFLTRIGQNCTVVVNGDLDQQDRKGTSGLKDAVKRLKGMGGMSIIEFDESDIVRSGIVREIVKRYRKLTVSRKKVSSDE